MLLTKQAKLVYFPVLLHLAYRYCSCKTGNSEVVSFT